MNETFSSKTTDPKPRSFEQLNLSSRRQTRNWFVHGFLVTWALLAQANFIAGKFVVIFLLYFCRESSLQLFETLAPVIGLSRYSNWSKTLKYCKMSGGQAFPLYTGALEEVGSLEEQRRISVLTAVDFNRQLNSSPASWSCGAFCSEERGQLLIKTGKSLNETQCGEIIRQLV